jgi:hypothetical protein
VLPKIDDFDVTLEVKLVLESELPADVRSFDNMDSKPIARSSKCNQNLRIERRGRDAAREKMTMYQNGREYQSWRTKDAL